jgi:FKBP-type peptidyl-prolyl cis-trans isomerase
LRERFLLHFKWRRGIDWRRNDRSIGSRFKGRRRSRGQEGRSGGEEEDEADGEGPNGVAPQELVIRDLEEGSGAEAKPGDEVTVHYVGVNYKTGKQFDASWDRGEPFTFMLGEGLVVEGWEKAFRG